MTLPQTNQVPARDHEVTGRQVHDRTLRVLEPMGTGAVCKETIGGSRVQGYKVNPPGSIHSECDECEEGGAEAEAGPDAEPVGAEGHFLLSAVDAAGEGTARNPVRLRPIVLDPEEGEGAFIAGRAGLRLRTAGDWVLHCRTRPTLRRLLP